MPNKNDMLEEVTSALQDAAKPASEGLEENIEIRAEDDVTEEPGVVGYVDKSGRQRFDGLLQDVDVTNQEDAAAVLEQLDENIREEREATGRGEKRTTNTGPR